MVKDGSVLEETKSTVPEAPKGKLLTRLEIIGVDDARRERVTVAVWGGDLIIRSLTGLERDRFEASILNQDGVKSKVDLLGARARLVSMTAVDEANQPLFTEDDILMLATKSAAGLDIAYDVAARLAGLTKETMEKLVGKGSGKTPSIASHSV